jgi:hypothetical protein
LAFVFGLDLSGMSFVGLYQLVTGAMARSKFMEQTSAVPDRGPLQRSTGVLRDDCTPGRRFAMILAHRVVQIPSHMAST